MHSARRNATLKESTEHYLTAGAYVEPLRSSTGRSSSMAGVGGHRRGKILVLSDQSDNSPIDK
jgi:hypothetical protein